MCVHLELEGPALVCPCVAFHLIQSVSSPTAKSCPNTVSYVDSQKAEFKTSKQ